MSGSPAPRGAGPADHGGPPERAVAPVARPRRPGYPLLVVSLPGRTASALREEMGRAAEGGADLVEIRLDRLGPGELERLDRVHELPLLHPWVPAIATLRSRAEGGSGPEDPAERARRLTQALELLPFSFVDLELARDGPLEETFRRVDGRPLSFVHSAHVPAHTAPDRVASLLEEAVTRGTVGKVVLPALAQEALELLPVAQRFRGRPFVLHTTGPVGALLRVLAPRLEMAWVYCSLPEPEEGQGRASAGEVVEPSQVPVDRMRRFVDQGPSTPWYAIVGRPLGHTLSPALHAAFLRATGTDGIYIPLELAHDQEFQEVLPRLIGWGLGGVNVTRPFKQAAYHLAAERSEEVTTSGAANTLVPLRGGAPPLTPGAFRAHNTDVLALLRWFSELGDPGRSLRDAVVFGAGGAARAAVTALVESGATVSVVARRSEAAQALAEDFPSEHVRARPAETVAPTMLVVNATPFGQEPGLTLHVPIDRALVRGGLLLDLVYRPRDGALRQMAGSAGAGYEDGFRMLLYQASESFRLFTGREVSPALLERWLRGGALEVAA